MSRNRRNLALLFRAPKKKDGVPPASPLPRQPAGDDKKIRIRSMRILLAIYFLQGMCFYGPVATLYRLSAGISVFQIGVIESISLGLALALELPWGWVADRIGHRRTIVFCTFLFAVSKVVFWRAETFGGFLAERVLLAVTVSGLSGCDAAYLSACAGETGAHRAFGAWEAVQTAGLLAAAATSSLFLGDNYRLAGLWTVASYSAAALLSLGLGEPEGAAPRSADGPRPRLAAALRKSLGLAPFLAGAALLSGTAQFVTVFLNQLIYRRAGIPTGWFGVLYGGVTVAALLGSRSHRVSARLGRRKAGAVLCLAAAGACALALLPVPALAVLGVVTLRVAAALFSPLSLAVQTDRADPAGRATQLSCNAMVADFVTLALTPALGRAADVGVPLALLISAGACLLGAALVWRGLGLALFPPKGRQTVNKV